jgi:hypothetical protein
MKPLLIVGGVIVIIVILASVLYVWANSLVEDELEGTWYDEENEWIEFSSDNTFRCEDCPFEGWSLGESSGEVGFCDDSPGALGGGCDGSYYYVYEYEVKGDVLFLAPHDSRGIIESAKCNILVKSWYDYNTANSETSPYWCDA